MCVLHFSFIDVLVNIQYKRTYLHKYPTFGVNLIKNPFNLNVESNPHAHQSIAAPFLSHSLGQRRTIASPTKNTSS